MFNSSCTLTQVKRMPWDDACPSYEVKPLIYIKGLNDIKPLEV